MFEAFNDETDICMSQHFPFYYTTWQNQDDATHLGIYYNMHVDKHVYINGSRKKKLEIFNFVANDEPRGFGDLYTLSIGLKIDCFRTCTY